jgi:L-ascorbate metabolism protein UlaG (beta-lactamase superfamily)
MVTRRTVLAGTAAATASATTTLAWGSPAAADDHAGIDLVWGSMANWLLRVGGVNILMDGYFTRLPESLFVPGPTGPLDLTAHPVTSDVEMVRYVHARLGSYRNLDYVLTGHSHFDHSLDSATWMKLTRARLIGSRTTAYQAIAWGTSPRRCSIVLGGETLRLGSARVEVMRWNHSGNPGALQHDPIELNAVPVRDPATGGLRAGVAEDFPTGGGGRAFLFTVQCGRRMVSLLWINSGSAVDLDVPIVVDGKDYGAPSANLAQALRRARVDRVDLAVMPASVEHLDRVLTIARPRAVLPHHWDGLYQPFLSGMPYRFADAAYQATVAAHDAELIVQNQFLDAWRLDSRGVRAIPNEAMRSRFDFPPVPVPAAGVAARTVVSCCGD